MQKFNIPGPYGVDLEKKHFDLIALIDADILKHLVTYDIHKDLMMNIQRSDSQRIQYIEDRLQSIFSSFSAKGYIFCFSGKSYSTFRHSIGMEREYKGSRTDPNFYKGKIEDMSFVVSYISNQYPTLVFSDLEADDVISMLQNDNTFVYSNDKDLLQIPGFHFDLEKWDVYHMSEEKAFYNLVTQVIKGDSTDSIPGLKGYGDKKSKELIESKPLKQGINLVLREYQLKHGLTEGTDMFCEMWMLVKLRSNRGTYFKEKYKRAFELLNAMQNVK